MRKCREVVTLQIEICAQMQWRFLLKGKCFSANFAAELCKIETAEE